MRPRRVRYNALYYYSMEVVFLSTSARHFRTSTAALKIAAGRNGAALPRESIVEAGMMK